MAYAQGGVSTLVISSGSTPDFVAAACEAEAALRDRRACESVVIWAAPTGTGPAADVVAAAERQAALLATGVATADTWLWRAAATEPDALGLVLARAVQVATHLGAGRIVWPTTAPLDASGEPIVDRVAAAIDTATLSTRLAASLAQRRVGGSPPAPRVECPLADLDDAQVMDLAEDFALDLTACWWHPRAEDDAAAAAEAARWSRAAHASRA